MTVREQPPGVVRGAVGVWLALGAFVVFTILRLWLVRGRLEEEAVRAGDDPALVTSALFELTLVTGIFALCYGLFAWLLKIGKRWSRGVLTALAVIHLLWIVLPGAAATAENLVTLLLIAVGLALTWLPATARWVRRL